MIKKSIVLTGLLCCLSFGYCYAEDVRPNDQDTLKYYIVNYIKKVCLYKPSYSDSIAYDEFISPYIEEHCYEIDTTTNLVFLFKLMEKHRWSGLKGSMEKIKDNNNDTLLLKSFYNGILSGVKDSLDRKIKQANGQAVVSNDEDKNNSEEPIPTEGTRNWHIIVLIIVGVVILLAGIVAGVYYCYKKVTALIKECESLKGELEEVKEQNEKLNEGHIKELEKMQDEIKHLQTENDKLKKVGNIKDIESTRSVNKGKEVVEAYSYLKTLSSGVSSGVFQKVVDKYDSECYFRFKKTNSNTARYEYYHEESASIVMDSEKYGSYVRGAVDVVERSSHKNKIETVEAGTIEYINGKWQIKNKAKIKIS